MKILILCNNANGLYLFRRELLLALIEDGHELHVSMPEDEFCEKVTELGVKFIPTLLDRRGSNPIKDFGLYRFYKGLIRDIKPDCVLTYTIKPNIYGAFACGGKIPCLVNVTGLGTAIQSGGLKSKLLLAMYRIGVSRARTIFFQNRTNMDFMQSNGIGVKNARLLPGSGVNLKEHPYVEYPTGNTQRRILAVIRVMKDKGINEYLEAADKLSGKKCSFVLAGPYEPETKEEYEPRIQKLIAENKLEYLGQINNVSEEMANSHIIVHPSYHEGLSNVLLEAAACGRPVIASDVAGCRETLVRGESGELVEAKNADALISAIEGLASQDDAILEKMGRKGRKYVEDNFSREVVIAAYREEINGINK